MSDVTNFPWSQPRGVRWIHPSYRDLVIEQLAIDINLRSRFLELMDIEGVKLAVSQAGGRRGDRRLPLLVSESDWKLLLSRSLEIVKNSDVPTAILMIRILRSATVDLPGITRNQLLRVLEACCGAIRVRVDETQCVIKEAELRELLEATVLIDPLPVLPQLGPTWKSATSSFRATIKSATDGSELIDGFAVEEWVRLTDLLVKNEPRFMRQVNYPQAFTGDITQLVSTIRREAELDNDDEDLDSLWAEADRMDILEKSLGVLADLFPNFAAELSVIRSAAASHEDYLREKFRESRPDSDESYDDDEARGVGSQSFDIEAVFIDL